ncbi:unnamed protein product [Lota lota]
MVLGSSAEVYRCWGIGHGWAVTQGWTILYPPTHPPPLGTSPPVSHRVPRAGYLASAGRTPPLWLFRPGEEAAKANSLSLTLR